MGANQLKYDRTPKGKHAARKKKLKARYGLTIEAYEALLAQQNYACAICRQPELRDGYRLSVDHNHLTNAVRGLLCKACNLMVGNAQDDPLRLRLAAEYLGG